MRLTYYGHAAFLVEAGDGTRIILDPYRSGGFDGALRYAPIVDTADAVIATHSHDDHGAVDTIPGRPPALIQPTVDTVGKVQVTGIDVYHDEDGGRKRGKNTIVVLDDGDIRLVHLGDLGHQLDAATVGEIGRADVLLVPVGGFFTIDHRAAAAVVEALDPRVVIPIHFKTPKVDFPIAGVEAFLATQEDVKRDTGSTLEVTHATLPSRRTTVVLEHSR